MDIENNQIVQTRKRNKINSDFSEDDFLESLHP